MPVRSRALIVAVLATGALSPPARAEADAAGARADADARTPVRAAGAPRPGCAARGSRTVLSTPGVRVYHDRRGRPFGCWRRTGRRVALDSGVDRFYAPRDARLQRVRLAGEVLGYTWWDPGVPAVYVHSVNLRTARFAHRTAVRPFTTFEPGDVAVPDLAVRGSGSLAWTQVVEGERSVWRFDRRGRRRLDVGPGIAPRSLRLRGSRLTWRDRGRLRAARLG